ncbi:MAG TPA: oligosaccharide flippase family protein [Aliidongia sp.]|nr:oligosaccharide flippase family protein [Aliidongia sp.]
MTDAAARSLAHRTAFGAAWLVSWRMISRLLGLCSTLILARLLAPGDFGLVAIATTYVNVFDALSALGAEDTIVRSPNPRRALFDTAFTVGALRGVVNALLVAATAPFVARAFNEPRLLPLLLVIAAMPLFDGLENVAIAEFRRELRFDREFILFVVPRLLAVATTIGAVMVERSVWALVIGIFAGKISRLLLTYIMRPFLPRPTLSAWRELAGYSFWTWASSIVGFARDRGWTLLLGAMLSATDVGIFNIAAEIAQLPITEMVNPIGRAAFSGISASRNAGGDIAAALARIIGIVALIILPASIGISALAYHIVMVGLGPGWATATTIIAVIGASSPSLVIMTMGNIALAATGNIRYNFFITVFTAAFALSGAAIGAHYWGLFGVTTIFVAVLTVEGVGFLIMTMRILGGKVSSIGWQVWRPALAAAVMAGLLYMTGLGWSHPPGTVPVLILNAAFIALVGAMIYAATLLLLWRLAGLPDSAERFLIEALRMGVGRIRRLRAA